jgi:hypothetical protein
MRKEIIRSFALLAVLAAAAGCERGWTRPDERAFADADARCAQAAMKAAPIEDARVVDCDHDDPKVHCGTRSELATTVKVPAPAEAEAVRRENLRRQEAYSECMARSGTRP